MCTDSHWIDVTSFTLHVHAFTGPNVNRSVASPWNPYVSGREGQMCLFAAAVAVRMQWLRPFPLPLPVKATEQKKVLKTLAHPSPDQFPLPILVTRKGLPADTTKHIPTAFLGDAHSVLPGIPAACLLSVFPGELPVFLEVLSLIGLPITKFWSGPQGRNIRFQVCLRPFLNVASE